MESRVPDNEDAVALRRRAHRRLIGAIALVLALVIIPPWVMDREPKPVVTNLTVEIPKQESSALKAPVVPAPAAAARTAAATTATATREQDAPRPPAVALEGQRPSTEAPSVASKTEVARAPDTARVESEARRAEAILNAETYVVPLGAFSSKENVKQLESKLDKVGVQHYTENVSAAGGEQTRVRAGPFPTKEVAEKTRE